MKKKLKLLIIGLDGATFDIINPLIRENKLPTLKKVIENGVRGELESTIPPLTAPAWVSFLTGKNPGKHGVFSFFDQGVGTHESYLGKKKMVISSLYSGSTFVDLLSSQGYRIAVITVPMTYPPWSINGVMISGYPCPDTDKIYYYSEDMKIQIRKNLNFPADYYAHTSKEKIINDCLQMMERRTNLAIQITKTNEIDCLILVLQAIDKAQHIFWRYYDPTSPFYDSSDIKFKSVIPKHYQVADAQINKLLKLTDQNTRIFIVSDHGAAPHPQMFFNINCWLKKRGLSVLHERNVKIMTLVKKVATFFLGRANEFFPETLKPASFKRIIGYSGRKLRQIGIKNINWQRTKAFGHSTMSFPTGGIIINVKGRQESGIGKIGKEYEELRDYIIEELTDLRDDDNTKVVNRCWKREEYYKGDFIEKFPDVIFLLNKKYIAGEGLTEVFTNIPKYNLSRSGEHAMNGILIAKSSVIKSGEMVFNSKIIDIAPTILYSLGISIPRSTDGRVLLEIFTDEFRREKPQRYYADVTNKRKVDNKLSKKEIKDMEKKLKALGYF